MSTNRRRIGRPRLQGRQQVHVWLPRDLHAELKKRAAADGRSINKTIELALRMALGLNRFTDWTNATVVTRKGGAR